MARVVAVANQKGGVAKTTTVQSLGAALAALGARVLLVDLDAQACLTYALGLDPDALAPTLHDVLLGRAKAQDALLEVGGVDLLPSSIDLAGSELHLLGRTGREQVLGRALDPVRLRYDVVLIDCAPSLGVLTVNALTAADEVLIPLQCEALSHRGVAQLLDTVDDVREFTNPGLAVRGAIATMFDGRTRHAREVLEDVRERFGLDVLEPPIPKSIRFAEAPGRGQSILEHAPQSAGAAAYRAIAATLWAVWRPQAPRAAEPIGVDAHRPYDEPRPADLDLTRASADEARPPYERNERNERNERDEPAAEAGTPPAPVGRDWDSADDGDTVALHRLPDREGVVP